MEPLLNFSKETIPQLQKGKNLLAFSAGVDSSALFFLLLEHSISFDIAFVNYNLRVQSKQEEEHARKLAKQYKMQIYISHAPSFDNNFEKNARDFRYDFFDTLMQNYDNLLTAHQLNDQLEWFLMRLTKGAGTVELIGLDSVSKRKDYQLLRPLLHHSKDELLLYLNKASYPYFIDQSNSDEKYERNRFRKTFSNQLIEEYKEGISHSFNYLQEDKKNLLDGVNELFHLKKLYILKCTQQNTIRTIDRYLKKLGYLLTGKQRQELGKERSLVLGGIWAVEVSKDTIFICPYVHLKMPKAFKESCRILNVPSKIRPYLYKEEIHPKEIDLKINQFFL